MKILRWAVLAIGSAVTAEFLLGDQYLMPGAGAGTQLGMLCLYIVYYGSAAIVVREVSRRLRRGWTTLLLLALAFAVIEEGLLTQSLFNLDYLGTHQGTFGQLPALGIAGPWTVFVLALHVVWSIGAPIALAEEVFAPRRSRGSAATRGPSVQPSVVQQPWFGIPALVIFGVLYALGGVAILVSSLSTTSFRASAGQLVVAGVVAAALIAVAIAIPRPAAVAPARHPFFAAGASFVLLSAFQFSYRAPAPWLSVGPMLAALAALAVVAWLWRLDPAGLGAGAVLVYCWVGLQNAAEAAPWCVLEQAILVALVLAALVLLAVRRRRSDALASTESSVASGSTVEGRVESR